MMFCLKKKIFLLRRSKTLKSKAMKLMFGFPFVYFLLFLDFGGNDYVIMTIFLLMHLLSFVDEF